MVKIGTSSFKRLIGIWKTKGIILSDRSNLKLEGTDTYELMLDGNYILHKADVLMGNEKSETFEIIELDNSPDKAKMQYFNSKGESGVMSSSLNGANFNIDGNRIKFRGTITDENAEIIGNWYLQTEANDWKEFIELKLTKQK